MHQLVQGLCVTHRGRAAPFSDDIQLKIGECDEMMATKKESAPEPDEIPYSISRCASGLGSQFLFNA